MRTRIPLVILALLAVLTFAFVACGDDKETEGPTATTSLTPGATQPSGEVPGVTDTEVVLGTHTSLTGPIATYSIIPRFAKAYFGYLNDNDGGVAGRKITYLEEDDQYNPAQAVDLTHKLVEQDNIFAMFNALGTPNHLQVIDYLQDNGVPDMFAATGATEWVKDPSARPLVFGSNPNYTGEGLAMAKWIIDTMGPDAKVGIIYQNDDFGIDGAAGVKLALAANVVGEEPYEVTDPDLNSQVDQLKSANADVVVLFATPIQAATSIKHARQDLGWDVQFAISAVSMNELTAIIAGPDNIEGTVGPAATYMAYQTTIPGVQRHLDILDATGLGKDKASVLTLYAQYVSELMVETLRIAGTNLTRESLVQAAESITDWQCSVCIFPLSLGPDDHDPAQGVAIAKYQGGQVVITDMAYSWEGVQVADLSLDSLKKLDVPADALTPPQ